MTETRVALVLGGGASRGMAHVGALGVLDSEGIEVEFIAGSSIGGLIELSPRRVTTSSPTIS